MALVEERVSSPRRPAEAPPQVAAFAIPRALVPYLALMAVGFLARVHLLGDRALHHDESLHAVYSWYLYVGRGYVHDPMMHGPFQFHVTALMYFLFGDSDFTARLAAVLFGTALIGLPYFLRHELGRAGALLAAAFFTLSPSFLYFSRFAREDIYTATWTLVLVVGVFGYLRTFDFRWLYVATIGLAFSFATKETTYITGFIVVTFAGLALLAPGLRPQVADALRRIAWRGWLGLAGLFLGINLVLHTSFFTNPLGACTMILSVQPICQGAQGALQYWLAQHEVERGGQPIYYYAMLFSLYEFLPLALAGAAVVALWRRATLFFWFTLYWAAAAFVIYSQAGEKMPWLLLHLNLPVVLLGALYLGRVVERVHWRGLVGWPAVAAGSLGLVLAASGIAWLGLGAVETLAPIEAQAATLRRIGLGLGIAATVGGLAYVWSRHGRAMVLPSLGLALGLVALFFYVRTAFVVTYVNSDTPSEPLIYVQSSPDIPWIVGEIERIGFQFGEGENVGILMDNGWGDGIHESVAWPFEWYLRDYTDKRYFSRTIGPEVDLNRYPILLAMATNLEPIRPTLERYHGQRYRLNWWFPEHYKLLDDSWKIGPITIPWLRWELLWEQLTDPVERANLLKFLVYRDTPSGGARELYFYVRDDVPALGPAPFATAEAAEPIVREAVAQAGPEGVTIYGLTAAGSSVLAEPKGVAVDAEGRIYVAESGAHRVTVFDPDGSIATSWGGQGAGDGEFNEPWGIGVAPNGEVYVADTWNHRIQRFSADGQFLGQWGRLFDPQTPLEQQPGAFWGPRDVAVATDGTVFVTDTGNKRIQVFDPQGRWLGVLGREGSGEGEFQEPVGLALDAQGNLVVADTWNGRVQRLDPDGRFLAAYPVDGWESTSLVNKPYLALLGDRVMVSQPEHGRVLVLDDQETWQPLMTGLDLQTPTGIAVAEDRGQAYVVDSSGGIVVRIAE